MKAQDPFENVQFKAVISAAEQMAMVPPHFSEAEKWAERQREMERMVAWPGDSYAAQELARVANQLSERQQLLDQVQRSEKAQFQSAIERINDATLSLAASPLEEVRKHATAGLAIDLSKVIGGIDFEKTQAAAAFGGLDRLGGDAATLAAADTVKAIADARADVLGIKHSDPTAMLRDIEAKAATFRAFTTGIDIDRLGAGNRLLDADRDVFERGFDHFSTMRWQQQRFREQEERQIDQAEGIRVLAQVAQEARAEQARDRENAQVERIKDREEARAERERDRQDQRKARRADRTLTFVALGIAIISAYFAYTGPVPNAPPAAQEPTTSAPPAPTSPAATEPSAAASTASTEATASTVAKAPADPVPASTAIKPAP